MSPRINVKLHSLISLLIMLAMDTTSTNYTLWMAPSSPTLPREAEQMAVCYDSNSSIYLMGGRSAAFSPYKQLVSYNIVNNEFTDIGVNYFSTSFYGWGQYYTQLRDTLWMINSLDLSKSLNKLNITSLSMTYYFTSIPSTKGALYGCIASFDSGDGYIIVTGGYDSAKLDTVYVYDIGSNVWLSGVSRLQRGREYHACTVHNGELYIIGGTNDGAFYIKSIEYITVSTTNNWSNSFVDMNDTLYEAIGMSNAVVYGNDILIIGGRYGVNGDNAPNTYINVIDTVSKTVRYGGTLKYAVYHTAAIIVNNYIYAFGGQRNTAISAIDTFLYHAIVTSEPNSNPTKVPSTNPTTEPTAEPTTKPTTIIPTTVMPTTSMPTTDIPTTVIPTKNPTTNIPTTNPTSVTPTTVMPTTTMSTTVIPTATSLSTSKPTYSRTTKPTHRPTADISSTDTATIGPMARISEVNNTFSLSITDGDEFKNDVIIYLSIVGILCLFVFGIAFFLMYRAFKSKHKSSKKSVDHLSAMVDVVNTDKILHKQKEEEQTDDMEDMYNIYNNNNNIETKNGITENGNDTEEMYINPLGTECTPHCTTPNTFIHDDEEEDEEGDGEIVTTTSTRQNVINIEINNTSNGRNDDIGEV